MASDLKIEILAYNLFNRLWDTAAGIKTKPSILEIYGDECKKDDDYEEACDEYFLGVICFRQTLFREIYKSEFTDEKVKSLETTLDCYEYVISTCDRKDLFGHLTVFQRMFATLTFVVHICLKMHLNDLNTIDVVKYGHLFWAIYFDNYTQEFHEKGGWKELRKEAKLYVYLPEFAAHFCKDIYDIQTIKEACVNYRHFKNAVAYPERKQKHTIHISHLWIKFRIEHFERYINTPFSFDSLMNAYQLEQLLEDLKLVLNHSTCNPDDVEISKKKNQGSAFLTEMSYSEINTKEINPNLNAGTKKSRLLTFDRESRMIEKASDNFSCISTDNLEESPCTDSISTAEELSTDNLEEFQCRNSISTTDELTLDIIDSNGNRNSSKICIDKQKDSMIGYLNDGNAEQHDETAHINQVIDIYQTEEIEFHKENYPRDLSNSAVAKESAHNFNGKRHTEEKLKIGVYSNIENSSEFSNTIDDTSTSHIGASEFDGSLTEPFLKDLKSVNKKANSDDEMKMIRKARKDLRNEQADPGIKNFLKLLLVLGDEEGTEFVFSMFESKEETLEKSQENLNKQKKRSKKKKTRK